MQLSFLVIIVIILVTASIVLTEFDEENTIMEISMEDSIHRMDPDETKDQSTSPNKVSSRTMRNAPISQLILNPSQRRGGRMTYVKAILPNPKTSPIQHLAEKFAQAELKSPKMQETFKKLTAVHIPRRNSQRRSARSKKSSLTLVTPENAKLRENYESSRYKRRRKRRRKRHKGDRNKDKRNSYRRKWYNPRVRFVRQIENSTRRNGAKDSKDRVEKSIDYRSADLLKNLNAENFQEGPYGNLHTGINYPGVQDFDDNYQNSMQDHDSQLNYGSNYSPINNRIYNADLTNSLVDNGEDFSLSNDQMAINHLNLPETNLYNKIPYNENVNDLDFPDSEGNPMDSKQYEFSDPHQFAPHKNFRNHLNGLQVPSNSNFHIRNKFYSKIKNVHGNAGIEKSKNIGSHIVPVNSNYRSESVNSVVGHKKNHKSKSHTELDTSEKPDNITEADSSLNFPSTNSTKSFTADYVKTTTRNPSTIKTGKNWRTRKNSKIDKSETSLETSNSVSGKNSTTEMSPQLKKLDAASSVSPQMKASTGSENLKNITEYRGNNKAIIKETREVAGQILNSIIEELEDLKLNRNQNEHKEGLPCRLSGSWITTQAGVRIDMLVMNHSVNVSLAKLNLPVGIRRRSLLNYTWNMTGYAPFRRGGPFSLVAIDDRTKSLAVFVGACRVCQGVDTIEGVWSIAREPRDCRDFQMATSIYNDIFRRTQLYSAIKKKQLAMSNNGKYATSSVTSSTKEE